MSRTNEGESGLDGGGPPIARQMSLHAVTQTLLSRGAVSRADLAKLTGLSRQTISDVVRELEQDGWLTPLGRTEGRPGRSSVVYELNGAAGLAAALDLGGTKLSVAICDLRGNVVAETMVPTEARGGRHVVDQIVTEIEGLVVGIGATGRRLRLVVLGTPGVFHPETTHIVAAPNIPGLDQIDVPTLLEQRLGAPVLIENDVNLAARGEQWRGHGAGLRNFVFIALGTGVGMGIVANGQLVRGARGAAGEIGYLPIGGDPYDARGFQLGTLEHAIGSAAMSDRYAGYGGAPGTSVRAIFDALATGDSAAVATIEETARLIAPAIAAVSATLDPEMVIVGGSIGIRSELLDPIRRFLVRCSPFPVRIEPSVLGGRAALVGAIKTAIDHMHGSLFGVDSPAPMANGLPPMAAALSQTLE